MIDSKTNNDEYRSPFIASQCHALNEEMVFLKFRGGRSCRVVNGKYITREGRSFYYEFDLEAELYLAAASPIRLVFDGHEVKGKIVDCEDFHVMIEIDKNFGSEILSALLYVEPWKLLEAQIRILNSINWDNTIVRKLLDEGPGLTAKDYSVPVQAGQDTAIRIAQDQEVTVIWGPPGTGKTYVMAQIAIRAMEQHERVLIVSHSNISVDSVIKSVAAQLRANGCTQELKNGNVIRYGYVRDDELSRETDVVSYRRALEHDPDRKKRINDLSARIGQLRRSGKRQLPEVVEKQKELNRLRDEIRTEEQDWVENAYILATTISKLTIDKVFENKTYDYVMFDEVSMAYLSQVICAASFAAGHLVCVGDFWQLGAIAQSPAKETLNLDIFRFLNIPGEGTRVHAHPWLVMLDEQRRMHPDIAAFPGKFIYGGKLKDHKDVLKARQPIAAKGPLPEHAMSLVDLKGTYSAAAKNTDNSRFNILSGLIDLGTALEAVRSGQENVAVITPYSAQTRLIRAMLLDSEDPLTEKISCATVHQFQGSERDMVIFDAVEDFPSSRAGWLMSRNENASVKRLINVAVTRSRGKFIAVADSRFWHRKFDGTNNTFHELLCYLEEKGHVVAGREDGILRYADSLYWGKRIRQFSDPKAAEMHFLQDLQGAKESIVLSIPDGKMNELDNIFILEKLKKALSRGVAVRCKTTEAEILLESWRPLVQETDNAVFPIVVIDDVTLWYGLPHSRGTFHDGDTGFRTIYPVYFRIKGNRTIELIKAFSDLENFSAKKAAAADPAESAVNTKAAQKGSTPSEEKAAAKTKNKTEKKTENGSAGIGDGLAAYVMKKVRCPECRQPMLMQQNKRGVFYLRCSSCKNMEYLTVDIVSEYLEQHHVTCPQHHCTMRAGLGKRGVYVRCPEGMYDGVHHGHLLDLNKI